MVAVCPGKLFSLNKVREEGLRQVCRIIRCLPPSAEKNVQWKPIDPAQVIQSDAGLLVRRISRSSDQGPLGGLEIPGRRVRRSAAAIPWYCGWFPVDWGCHGDGMYSPVEWSRAPGPGSIPTEGGFHLVRFSGGELLKFFQNLSPGGSGTPPEGFGRRGQTGSGIGRNVSGAAESEACQWDCKGV